MLVVVTIIIIIINQLGCEIWLAIKAIYDMKLQLVSTTEQKHKTKT